MAEWLEEVNDVAIPYMLDSTSLKAGGELGYTTATQRQRLFCGYMHHQRPSDRPLLLPAKDPPVNREPYEACFDVDSYVALASSLAVAVDGLKILLVQRPTPPIKSSLHLGRFPVWYHDDPEKEIVKGRAHLGKIPQIMVGRFTAKDDLELTIAFPHAVRTNQQTAKLTDEDFAQWMDEIFIPTLHDVLPASQSRTLPISHADAVSKSQIRARNLLTEGRVATQLLAYHVQPQYLRRIWTRILELLHKQYPLFQAPILVVTAKGIKNQTSSTSWHELRQRTRRMLTRHINRQFVRTAFYDIGKEWIYPESAVSRNGQRSGQVALWNMKYLYSAAKKLRNIFPDAGPSALKTTQYPTYFLHGVGSVTVEASDTSPYRTHGLLYAQWYNTVKDLYAAGDNYLAANPAVADLGLDPSKLAALRHAAQTVSPTTQDALIRSYLHMKHHIHNLQGGIKGKSYGLREEYRVRQDLFDLVSEHMDTLEAGIGDGLEVLETPARGALETTVSSPHPGGFATPTNRSLLRDPQVPLWAPADEAYTRLTTQAFADWTAWNTNRLCFGLEFVFANVPAQTMISWEQTRAIAMFFLAIPCFLGMLNTSGRSAEFWHDELPPRSDDDEQRGGAPRQGMGMLDALEHAGFPWFMNKLNWASLTFKAQLSGYLGFQRLEIERRLRRHACEVLAVRDFSERIENSYPWLVRFGRVDACRQLLFLFYFQICAHQFRRDTLKAVRSAIKDNRHGQIQAGEIPLCYDALADAMIRGPRGLKIKGHSKDKIKSWTQLSRALFLDQVPKHAQNVSYHLVYQSAIDTITNALGQPHAQAWSSSFFLYLRATNWLLPYPQNNRFVNRDPESRVHPDGKPFLFWSSWHREIDKAVERHGRRVPVPLPIDWEHRYRGGWADHCKGMLLKPSPSSPSLLTPVGIVSQPGRPELDIALIVLPSTDLYDRLVELAGPEFDLDDSDDEEYLPDHADRIVLRPNELLMGDDQAAPQNQVIQTRAQRRRCEAENHSERDVEMTEEAFAHEAAGGGRSSSDGQSDLESSD